MGGLRLSRGAATGCSHGRQPMGGLRFSRGAATGCSHGRQPMGGLRLSRVAATGCNHGRQPMGGLRFSRGAATGCSHGRQPMECIALTAPKPQRGDTRQPARSSCLPVRGSGWQNADAPTTRITSPIDGWPRFCFREGASPDKPQTTPAAQVELRPPGWRGPPG